MSDNSQIGWTDASWNPVTGCTKVSPGCAHCYAEALTLRFKHGPAFLPGIAKIELHPDRLDQPLHWRRPRRIFVNSMSDLFHEDVPEDFIMFVFAVMASASQHTFQVLTKRPDRMRDFLLDLRKGRDILWRNPLLAAEIDDANRPFPPSNIWVGVSVENQYWADRRIPVLLETLAAVRFLSVEPLLKSVDLRNWLPGGEGWTDRPNIQWVIVGGETGPRHRIMPLEAIQSVRDQAVAAGIPLFVKQDSGPRPGQQGRLSDELWAHKEFPR